MRLINDQELLLVTGAGNEERDQGGEDSKAHTLDSITQNEDGTLSQGGVQTVVIWGNTGIEPINFFTPTGFGIWFGIEVLKELLKQNPNLDVNQDRSL